MPFQMPSLMERTLHAKRFLKIRKLLECEFEKFFIWISLSNTELHVEKDLKKRSFSLSFDRVTGDSPHKTYFAIQELSMGEPYIAYMKEFSIEEAANFIVAWQEDLIDKDY